MPDLSISPGFLSDRIDPQLLEMYHGAGGGVQQISALSGSPADRQVLVNHDDRVINEDGLQVRMYRARGQIETASVLLYIHGGGFMYGSPAQFDPVCDFYVRELGVTVVSVRYRLAPAHPYPAAVDDALSALRWVATWANELGARSDRIGVVGISAGGAIAASTVLRYRDEDGATPRILVLHSPCLDDRHETLSSQEITDPKIWNRELSVDSWQQYLGGGAPRDRYAVPARASNLHGLGPVYLSVGQLEVGRDETVEFANRLVAAQVPTELHVFPGAVHGFEVKAPGAQISRSSLALQVGALRRALD